MEELKDLLNPKKEILGTKAPKLKIRSSESLGVYVENLTEVYVSSAQEVYFLMNKANKNRSVGRTNMNSVSSRSHLLFKLSLHQSNTEENTVTIHSCVKSNF